MNLEKKIEITKHLSNNWFPERRDNGEKNWMEGKGGLRVESKKANKDKRVAARAHAGEPVQPRRRCLVKLQQRKYKYKVLQFTI